MADRGPGAGVGLRLLVALLLGGFVAGASTRTPPAPTRLCLDVLDVGQGDALLLSLPGGEHWLVDAGGDPMGEFDVGERVVLPELRRRGIGRIDRLFLSHGDADHAGGATAILRALPVGELWIPTRRKASGALRRALRAADAAGVPVHEAVAGALFADAPAPVDASLLHPWPGLEAESGNDGSLVLRLSLGEVSFLLTGDLEAEGEARLARAGRALRSTVLKVPHHGSRTSSTDVLVERVDPLVALAGAGRENRFGFPHASVSRRYLTRGAPLFWTGRHGALQACTDGWSLDVQRRGDDGRLQPLQRWDAEQLGHWRHAGAVEAPPAPPEVCEPRSRRSKRRARAPRRARKPRARKAKKASGATGEPAPEPTPPELLDDRAWERKRKNRGRLRAPWKGG